VPSCYPSIACRIASQDRNQKLDHPTRETFLRCSVLLRCSV